MSVLSVGIDVGSTTTKVVVLRDDSVASREIAPTGADVRETTKRLYAAALGSAGVGKNDAIPVTSTGYGRRLVDFRSSVVSEITANAAGARSLYRDDGGVRTIIDVGGQDSKAIALDAGGRVVNFAMNDKCAAGTGRFLEVMARLLETDLAAMSALALTSDNPEPITSLCTVFAESEVIGLVSEGKPVADIVAGIHASIASRVGALVRRVGVHEPVLFDGGAAINPALRRALERCLDVQLILPEHPQFVTATGATLLARDRNNADLAEG